MKFFAWPFHERTDEVVVGRERDGNAVVARVAPEANPETVAEAARRWKHLSAMTQAEQESILTQSLVDRARRQGNSITRSDRADE